MQEVIIVGAGVAGLACLNHFLDVGIEARLFEAGKIGAPKVCGEFLAQSSIDQLQAWGVGPIQLIEEIKIIQGKNTLTISKKAGAMERSLLEMQLANRARALGGQIFENSPFTASMDRAMTHVFATGKIGATAPVMRYRGYKTYSTEQVPTCLEMHLFKGGYMGIVPINATTSNLAAISLLDAPFDHQGYSWQEVLVPEFGMRKMPDFPNCYFIGDALASFPPAAGGGASFALQSAKMAVSSFLQNDPQGYRAKSQEQFTKQMRIAKLLHQTMLSPLLSSVAMRCLTKGAIDSLLHHIAI